MPETGKLEEHNETARETLEPLVETKDETATEAADAPSGDEALDEQADILATQGAAEAATKPVETPAVFALLNDALEIPVELQDAADASSPSDASTIDASIPEDVAPTEAAPEAVVAAPEAIASEDVAIEDAAPDEAPVAVATVEAESPDQSGDETPAAATDFPVEEASGELPPDLTDWDGIDDFADSIVTGLEQAGIPIDADASLAQLAGRAADEPGLPEDHEAFFAGWGDNGGESDAARTKAAESLAAATVAREGASDEPDQGYQSLTEIGLASAASAAADLPSSQPDKLSEKHDELADAVQSALESIYGGMSSGLAQSGGAAFGFAGVGRSASAAGKPEPASSTGGLGESLSPQDVILSYFDYEAKKQAARPSADSVLSAAPTQTPTRPAAEAYKPEPRTYRPEPEPSAAPQWVPPQNSLYQGAPAYPVPAGVVAPPPPAAAQSSSRVLGAAAIGLVGGIAIAASLAVFVINAYGPQLAKTATATRAPDSPEPGYGPPIRFDIDQQAATSFEARALAEPARIAVADSSATRGQPAPLAITVRPERLREQALVSITGVPSGARLNAGVDAGGGNWLLPPNRLNGLTINLPQNAPETVPLAVELVDTKSRTPLSDRQEFAVRIGAPRLAASEAERFTNAVSSMAMSEITAGPESQRPQASPPSFSTQTVSAATPAPRRAPAAVDQPSISALAAPAASSPAAEPERPVSVAPPAPIRQAALAPQPQPEPERLVSRSATSVTEIEDLIREGNKRMREGDILQARQFYQKAVISGDPEAALAMGRSYDPIYFARIEKKNAEPDAARAFDWYRKAMDGGAVQTAKVRIENLKHFLNE
ncbi:hypothetical protein Rvan_0919 [Rhodomicrobium vannielii ATCC 17100]|uniref:Sel1 domain protein repeat-containing protein n=1 Tax=Rhodomicrobium vannielii (strain ATCC 17100 / DSM 162 / LMG 4299 / NCIMB 10020 / ATH 3.1.1) TaxID=648757 RepID=E3I1X6_RHOVT|nr:hypothetical protein [Rhodomicrobium vannielii]ADP70195.1 hypothetical protein Rvan_0919 [Rhodomicrobium vannielii ATCC 17100]